MAHVLNKVFTCTPLSFYCHQPHKKTAKECYARIRCAEDGSADNCDASGDDQICETSEYHTEHRSQNSDSDEGDSCEGDSCEGSDTEYADESENHDAVRVAELYIGFANVGAFVFVCEQEFNAVLEYLEQHCPLFTRRLDIPSSTLE